MYTLYTAIRTYPHQVQSQPHPPCDVHSIHSYTYLPPPSTVPAPPTLQCTLYTQLYVLTPTQCSPSPTHLAMYTLYTAIRTYPHPVQSQPHPPCNVHSIHSYTYLPPPSAALAPPTLQCTLYTQLYVPTPTQCSPSPTHLAMSSSVRGRVSSVSALSGSSLACWNWCSCSRSNNRCMLDFRCFNCIHCEQEGGGGGGGGELRGRGGEEREGREGERRGRSERKRENKEGGNTHKQTYAVPPVPHVQYMFFGC